MSHPNVIPCFRYQDAPAAIEWLGKAFGAEPQLVVPGPAEGEIAHAQLRIGAGMIMLGSAGKHGNDFDALVTSVAEAGGRCTQTVYVVVEDPKAHHDRAAAAGAEIVMPLEAKDYGGSGYGCRDLEGNVWSFGDFDPYAE
ncbi:MAG TPA: VOC family protein [Myxococcota bacterium]|nr:VOC family protein [Myxococcota bacterium]